LEIRNHKTNMVLEPQLQRALAIVREARGFEVESYIEQKIDLLNAYYRQAGLRSAVVAVSGGIDSAVVLGLVAMAMERDDSVIERIVAITMPDRKNQGVTGQEEAADLAELVCKTFNVPCSEVNMSAITQPLITEVELYAQVGFPREEKEDWCRGQVTSYARTAVYYYATSVLAANGTPGLVIGTTNLSEGGYLGYFGKASDGMVDLQLISDIYKSEVYDVARFLGVPEEVLIRAPTGDMFDATTDEVVFGAPYDFVELYQEFKRAGDRAVATGKIDPVVYDVTFQLSIGNKDNGLPAAQAQWEEYSENLERMHQYNAHKYLGRSPAVHLDILDCKVQGGWDNPAWKAKD
jgi:NAD+ synthetase